MWCEPRLQSAAGAAQAYNNLQGLSIDGQEFIDPITGKVTNFVVNGNPVSGTGWFDGQYWPPGDRYWLMSSGPFNWAAGDTQRVTIALVVGQGSDHLTSITWMRYYDLIIQDYYDNGYQMIPNDVPAPQVSVVELDRRIVLYWDSKAIEFERCGYRFQGFNLYQGETEQGPWKRIATYDKKDNIQCIWDYAYLPGENCFTNRPVQYGRDLGVAYSAIIENDSFSHQRLINGRNYYFSVTAYVYNPSGSIKTVETKIRPLLAIPGAPLLNTKWIVDFMDTLAVTHTGSGKGTCVPIVLDPNRITGNDYEVNFYTGPEGEVLWRLVDLTTGEEKLANQFHQGDDAAFLVVDGLLIKVIDSEASPHGIDDSYTFKTEAPITSDDVTRSRLNEINVFPNPYFGYNSAESSPYRHFVTFSHLPPECIIRIFSLSGQLVKMIQHVDGTGFEQWDLSNDASPKMPVASGMYIAHIMVPNVGERVLKLAVVMPQESFILYE